MRLVGEETKNLSSAKGFHLRAKALSTLATIVAEFGDCRRRGDAISGDYSRQCGQGLSLCV